MSRDEAAYVADMLEACERICSYVVDLNERTLRDDIKTVDAVLRNLAVLGEAAKRVSDPTRNLASAIPWRPIAGLRDVVIHDYFGVDLDVVCDVTFAKVPALREELKRLAPSRARFGSAYARVRSAGGRTPKPP